MKLLFPTILIWVLTFCMFGCSGDPVIPADEPDISSVSFDTKAGGDHQLLGYNIIQINTQTGSADVIPLRAADFHLNVVGIMNQTMGVTAAPIPSESDPANGLFVMDITLAHPFGTKPRLAGFDVRGILITKGTLDLGDFYIADFDEPQLINNDGYTRWWNAYEFNSPGMFGYIQGDLANTNELFLNANVNPFKIFADALTAEGNLTTLISTPLDDDAGRGVFTAGSSNTRRYELQFELNPGPVVRYGYAIDASWAIPSPDPPSEIPDDFPIEANCQEPFYVTVTEVLNTLFVTPGGESGGALSLFITVSDWQGIQSGDFQSEIGDVAIIAPDLFDGSLPADFYQETPNGITYTADISGITGLPQAGEVRVVCEVTSSSGSYDQGLGDAPDGPIAAYQVLDVNVDEINCTDDDSLEPFALGYGDSINGTVCNPDDTSDLYITILDPGYEPSGSVAMYCDIQDMSLTLYDENLNVLAQVSPVDSYSLINFDDFDYNSGQFYVGVETSNPDSIAHYILGFSGEPVDVTPVDPVEITPDEWFMFAEHTWIEGGISYSIGSLGAWVYDANALDAPVYQGQSLGRLGKMSDSDFNYPYAYFVGDNHEGTADVLGMVDFSNPSSPVIHESIFSGDDNLDSVCMDSQYLYIGYHTDGGNNLVVVYNYLNSPSDPDVTGFVSVEGIPSDIAIMDPDTPSAKLIVNSANDELNAYDASDPSDISTIGSGYPYTFQFVNDMDVSGNHILLAGKQDSPTDPGLIIVDLEGDTFTWKGVAPVGSFLKYLDHEWPYVFMNSENNEFSVINCENVEAPVVIDTVANPNQIGSLAVDSDKLGVVKSGDGVLFYDVADPSNVTVASELLPVNRPTSAAFAGSTDKTMIVSNITGSELVTFDVNGNPFILDRHKTEIAPFHMSSYGNLLSISTQIGNNWDLYDISDPESPDWFGNTQSPLDWIGAIQLYQNAFFAADDIDDDISVFDLTDPSNPSLATTLDTIDPIIDYEVAPGYLYALSPNALLFYSLTDPVDPQYEGAANPATSEYLAMFANGNYLYVSSQGQLTILDISVPGAPSVESNLDHGNFNLNSVTVHGQFAFLQGPETDIHVIRIWPQDDPAYIGSFSGYGGCHNIESFDGLLYVFSRFAGLRIFQL